MEVDRKRPNEGPVPDAKRPNVEATGPVTPEEIEQFQKEAIFRQMNAYKRERDELQSQLAAMQNGDEAIKSELADLTQKYVTAAKQVERLSSPSVARLMSTGKSSDGTANGSSGAHSDSSSRRDSGAADSTGGVEEGTVDSKALLEAQNKLAAAEGEIAKLQEFLSTEDKKRAELEQQINKLEERFAESPSNSQSIELRLKEAYAETQRLVIEARGLQQQLADYKAGQAEYEMQIREKYAATIAALERRSTSAESDVLRIRSARDELLSEVNVLKAEGAEYKHEAARLKELIELDNTSTRRQSNLGGEGESATAGSSANPSKNSEEADLPKDADSLLERCKALIRQNKALTEEISGLEQGFARANAKAKSALAATSVAEQKLGVLNSAKVRSDEKYIGAMRARDALNQELTRTKQALSKSAEFVTDQKALEQKLSAQLTRLQKQLAQSDITLQHRQHDIDAIKRSKQESDAQLVSARAVQETLREQLAQREAEKAAAVMARRTAETTIEKLQRQLDTQRAVSGLGEANEVQEQLESLRSIAMCPVCQKNWKDRALITCGHTMCADCVQSRLSARMRKCPMCNGHFASNDVLPIHL